MSADKDRGIRRQKQKRAKVLKKTTRHDTSARVGAAASKHAAAAPASSTSA